MSERKPTVLKAGMKTYRVALYEVKNGQAELIDLLEFDAKSTKDIFRTLHRRLQRSDSRSNGLVHGLAQPVPAKEIPVPEHSGGGDPGPRTGLEPTVAKAGETSGEFNARAILLQWSDEVDAEISAVHDIPIRDGCSSWRAGIRFAIEMIDTERRYAAGRASKENK